MIKSNLYARAILFSMKYIRTARNLEDEDYPYLLETIQFLCEQRASALRAEEWEEQQAKKTRPAVVVRSEDVSDR